MFIDGNLSNLTPAQQDVVLAKPYWRMRRVRFDAELARSQIDMDSVYR